MSVSTSPRIIIIIILLLFLFHDDDDYGGVIMITIIEKHTNALIPVGKYLG